jgi:ferredoxin-NADP reductase
LRIISSLPRQYWKVAQFRDEVKPFTCVACDIEGNFDLFIQIHPNGWTDRLARTLLNPEGAIKVGSHLTVDGPHATLSKHFRNFRQLMLFANGVGITMPLSILKDLDPNMTVTLEWTIRDGSVLQFEEVIKMLFDLKKASLARLQRLHIQINVTGMTWDAQNRLSDRFNVAWNALGEFHEKYQRENSAEEVQFFVPKRGRSCFATSFANARFNPNEPVGVFVCGGKNFCFSVEKAALGATGDFQTFLEYV